MRDRKLARVLIGATLLLAGQASLPQPGFARPADQAPHEHQHPMPAPPGAPPGEPGESPYAAPWLETVEIRALRPDEVAEIAAGQGAGLAKAAELNGLPGPRHVLDLAGELGLTAEQQACIDDIFAGMRAAALLVGARYLAAQVALEADFRGGSIAPAALGSRVAEVSGLRAELETVHLAAHLSTTAELTPEQIARYQVLRGYAGS